MIVRGKRVRPRVIREGRGFAARVGGRKASILQSNNRGRLAIGFVIEASGQRGRQQAPIDGGGEGIRTENRGGGRIGRICVLNLEPVVVNAVGEPRLRSAEGP